MPVKETLALSLRSRIVKNATDELRIFLLKGKVVLLTLPLYLLFKSGWHSAGERNGQILKLHTKKPKLESFLRSNQH